MSSPANPFTLVYDALWACTDRHPTLAALKSGNKVKFNQDSQAPLKDVIQDADLPELILRSDGLQVALYDTSSTSKFVRKYTWVLSTGSYRIDERLYQIEWAIAVAMLAWPTVLGALTWQGNHFVKRVEVTQASEGESDSQRNRGIKGFSALWSCDVHMHIPTAILKSELT